MSTPENAMNTPSAEALRLAVKLSGHTYCQRHLGDPATSGVCDGCLGDAATIDRELQLPARNAALLLAQGVCHSEEIDLHMPEVCDTASAIDELREALKGIRCNP